jgi:hypothetical protein
MSEYYERRVPTRSDDPPDEDYDDTTCDHGVSMEEECTECPQDEIFSEEDQLDDE